MKSKNKNLKEVFTVFFRLGCIAFGGPAAHISMMEEEVVEKRKWMSKEHFLDLMGATNLIPGPNSTEMTMHCGHERAGVPGLFVAGISFIFPAALITGIIAWFYTKFGHLPQVAPFVYGIKPAVLAIIASAIMKLGKKALKNTELVIIGLLVVALSFLGFNEVLTLLGAGILGGIYFNLKNSSKGFLIPIWSILTVTGTLEREPKHTWSIFLTFLKVGAVLYGSGYVLFAYLDTELVEKGWLSQQQLIDAIAMGQFTPGPVLSTATFIGYQLGGFYGAIAATLGIFLPSFLFVWILNPFIPKMRKSKTIGYFLDTVNVAAVAIMLAVLLKMGISTLQNWKPILIALIACIMTFGPKKLSSVWVILSGGVLGYLLNLF